MRILFLSEYVQTRVKCGARDAARLHYKILQDIVGPQNIDLIAFYHNHDYEQWENCVLLCSYNNKFDAIHNVICGNSLYISKKNTLKLLKLCNGKHYDVLFLDNRTLGSIIPDIKKKFPKIKIVTNFHGISRYQFYENVIKKKRIYDLPRQLSFMRAEKDAVEYSDIIFVLNDREHARFEHYYGKAKCYYIPCVLYDFFDPTQNRCGMEKEHFNLLFVGGYYKPNNEGIVWFVKNVMPLMDENVHLYIIGYKIDGVFEEYHLEYKENIHFIGTVNDLKPWYNCADLVIVPIFDGDGMKTKTAEALMFGKKILSTREGLVGYSDIIAEECNSASEFEIAIKKNISLNENSFYIKNRQRFLEEYSVEAISKKFLDCLNYLGEK